jgi:cytochrome c oxidase subunit 2
MSDDHGLVEMEPTPGEKISAVFKQRDVRIATAWGVLVTFIFFIIGGWIYPSWMPVALSTDMKSIERLIVIFTWISAPICGIVLGFSIYTFLHRHKGDTPPPDGPAMRTNPLIVGAWVIISSALCLVAVVYGLIEMNTASAATAEHKKNAMVVEVTGSQWAWSFNYPEQGVTSHELNLPINRAVEFRIISVDVNHSFWPVQLGVKVDANRLQTTVIDTTPNKLGVIDVKCAELCGLYHAYMETGGEVMSVADFDAWVTSHQGGHTA